MSNPAGGSNDGIMDKCTTCSNEFKRTPRWPQKRCPECIGTPRPPAKAKKGQPQGAACQGGDGGQALPATGEALPTPRFHEHFIPEQNEQQQYEQLKKVQEYLKQQQDEEQKEKDKAREKKRKEREEKQKEKDEKRRDRDEKRRERDPERLKKYPPLPPLPMQQPISGFRPILPRPPPNPPVTGGAADRVSAISTGMSNMSMTATAEPPTNTPGFGYSLTESGTYEAFQPRYGQGQSYMRGQQQDRDQVYMDRSRLTAQPSRSDLGGREADDDGSGQGKRKRSDESGGGDGNGGEIRKRKRTC